MEGRSNCCIECTDSVAEELKLANVTTRHSQPELFVTTQVSRREEKSLDVPYIGSYYISNRSLLARLEINLACPVLFQMRFHQKDLAESCLYMKANMPFYLIYS